MEWISVKEKKPENDGLCLVLNNKGWMGVTLALYYTHYDIFLEFNENRHNKLALDVTHYLSIPIQPRYEE